ncbi:MAG: imelysin family protein [Pseudotabrizicola sp.]|uniref:imelysin family protein n=1 Tax=Pseudotabrizicola sp. TaxID=2939647 RepID=UPI002722F3A8|nr:imelysin family protein [Pseudotabrizicola sp.]MDO9639925.1 imelysin family protein [Pseudotabrizicola sp.]
MKHVFLLALLAMASPVRADVDGVVASHILPGFARFAQAAGALDSAAQSDCSPGHVEPAFQATFDAWMAVADLRIGPSEMGALSLAFWPDDRGVTPRALNGLIAGADPVGRDALAFAEVSIAARGFFALEMLLHDPAFSDYGPAEYTCTLVRTVTADLARQAKALDAGWAQDFAPVLITAGAAGNATYLSPDEAVRALYTQLLTSLEVTANARLGRPLGTFERPRPRQAEAWRSGRSLRNVVLAVEAAQALAHGLSDGDLPLTDAAVVRVHAAASAIADPAFQDVEAPQARLKVEVLQQAVQAMRSAVVTEIGDALGIAAGFNSQDGD